MDATCPNLDLKSSSIFTGFLHWQNPLTGLDANLKCVPGNRADSRQCFYDRTFIAVHVLEQWKVGKSCLLLFEWHKVRDNPSEDNAHLRHGRHQKAPMIYQF